MFSKKFNELLKQRKMTTTELSSELGVDKEILDEWTQDKKEPSLTDLRKVINYFGVESDYFFTAQDKPYSQVSNKKAEKTVLILESKTKKNLLYFFLLFLSIIFFLAMLFVVMYREKDYKTYGEVDVITNYLFVDWFDPLVIAWRFLLLIPFLSLFIASITLICINNRKEH